MQQLRHGRAHFRTRVRRQIFEGDKTIDYAVINSESLAGVFVARVVERELLPLCDAFHIDARTQRSSSSGSRVNSYLHGYAVGAAASNGPDDVNHNGSSMPYFCRTK